VQLSAVLTQRPVSPAAETYEYDVDIVKRALNGLPSLVVRFRFLRRVEQLSAVLPERAIVRREVARVGQAKHGRRTRPRIWSYCSQKVSWSTSQVVRFVYGE
jgi:hypothetical protein